MTIYSKDIKTRSTDSGELKGKGSALTHAEMDLNLIYLYADFRNMQIAPYISAYNAGTTYDDTVNKFATYNSYLWKWISPVSGSGVTCGTDPTKWERVMVNEMAHAINRDAYLDRGGSNEVQAKYIPKYKEVTLTSAEILSGSPIELLALTASKYHDIISITAEALIETVSPASIPYDGGSLFIKTTDSTENIFNFIDFFGATTPIIRKGVQAYADGNETQLVRGKSVVAVCDSCTSPANVTGGDYDVLLKIHYLTLE